MINAEFVGVRMPTDLRKQVKEIAEREYRSESNVIKVALVEWLARRREMEVAQRPQVAHG